MTSALENGRSSVLTRTSNKIAAPVLAVITIGCILYYGFRLEWTILEVVRFLIGIFLLWAPFAILCYLLLQREISDIGTRVTLSLLASYALTTLTYFGCAELLGPASFYVLQVIVVGAIAAYLIRQKQHRIALLNELRPMRVNWLLLAIIAGSLLVSLRFQATYYIDPSTGNRVPLFFGDLLYSAALSQELDRNIPPRQATTAGGLPERAYHMFPHLTTTLLARYSGQSDMLRAGLIYHYMIIAIMLCIALYTLAKNLANSAIAGYIAAAIMYLIAFSFAPIVPNIIDYFYFTIFPHVSSGLDPAALTSPQMYSSLLVLYGLLLGFALISRAYARKQPANILLILTALIVVASLRFRVHLALAALPAFLLLMGTMWLRRRKAIFIAAAVIAATGSFLLYLEMNSPVYLAGSTSIGLYYNGLTTPGRFFNSWPFAAEAYTALSQLIPQPNLNIWGWQVLSLAAFSLLNVVGIPLCLATGYFFWRRPAASEWNLYRRLIVLIIVFSLLVSILVTMGYDAYSVPGQMPFQIRWYIFPFAAVWLAAVVTFLQRYLKWPNIVWVIIGMVIIVGTQIAVQLNGPDIIVKAVGAYTIITADDYQVLRYIHDTTPPNSVVLSRAFSGNFDNATYALSGIGGRAAYFEVSPMHAVITAAYHQDRRLIMDDIWAATDDAVFCQKLAATPINYLIVDQRDPLQLKQPATCLTLTWQTPDKTVALWQVTPQQ